MKATGIVRRIDDLGRVVIPKEIRRAMRIREGDPLELYTDGDVVMFKLYRPVGNADWDRAGKLISHILDCDFCLYDSWSRVFKRGNTQFENVYDGDEYDKRVIGRNGDIWCYLVTEHDEGNEKRKVMAVNVLSQFLEVYFD